MHEGAALAESTDLSLLSGPLAEAVSAPDTGPGFRGERPRSIRSPEDRQRVEQWRGMF